jgi:cell division protein FtsW (lipid II flippase)
MVSTMLAMTLATALLLAGGYVLFARVFTRRRVRIHEDPDEDPLLAVPDEDPVSARRMEHPRRVALGALFLALALTTLGIAMTVDFGAGAFWAAVGIGLLYAALVFFEAAGSRRIGPN